MANIRLGLIVGSAANCVSRLTPRMRIGGTRNPVVALQAE